MNVKQLKELVMDLPDDTPVVTAGLDHSYREIKAVHCCPAVKSPAKKMGATVVFLN
jgi:hypothetical protein